MIEFFRENGATIIVAAVMLLLITLVVIKMIRDKKSGKSSCGCDCGSCGCNCHGSAPKKPQPKKVETKAEDKKE